MSIILGLDVSTSCIGVCVIDSGLSPDESGSHILFLDRIEFKRCKTMWEKADVVSDFLRTKLLLPNGNFIKPDAYVLEEPLLGFSKGMSSASTITSLMRFNGIVSYICRQAYGIDPVYLSAATARKTCGIKLMKRAVGGPQKEQVFNHMSKNDLKHVVWPKKKNGLDVDWSRDATDAYVIARAHCVIYMLCKTLRFLVGLQ